MPQGIRKKRDNVSLAERETAKKVWSFNLVFVLFGLLGLGILCKILWIQMIEADMLQRKAQLTRNQSVVLFNRGRILDRRGVILAQDTLLYDLFAHPAYYAKAKPEQIAKALSPFVSLELSKLTEKLKDRYSTIGVTKNIHKSKVDIIKKVRIAIPRLHPKHNTPLFDEKTGAPLMQNIPIPGLDFVQKTVRNYPQGNLASHVLGYVNDEAHVSSGVENSARDILKKAPTNLNGTEFSGRGEFIKLENMTPEEIVRVPKAEDVTLTIDSRLQYIAERELNAGIIRTKAKRGSVVIMDPRSGEVLAFAVAPNFHPSQFYKAPAETLKNWAITDVYPPGSTFKILTVTCGLETGVINPKTTIMDTGKMTIGGWPIQNYDYGKRGAPGTIDLVYLFQHSSNIASAKISMMTPKKAHRDLLMRFGIGQKTGIDLPGESSGIMRDLNDWDLTTHATIGFGYGLASTPIQMAAAISAIANKGIWTTPHVVKGAKVETRRVISAKTAQQVTELLTKSIDTAPTSTVKLDGFHVAGKTGTSRKPRENGRGYDSDLFTSFVGFFPAEDPKLLVMVVVDSPRIGEAWGSTVAGPIFHNIATESIGYLGMKPIKSSMQTATNATVQNASARDTLIKPYHPKPTAAH